MQDVIDYVIGKDESELAKTKAELGYALHCLEREIAINHDLQSQLVTAKKALVGIADTKVLAEPIVVLAAVTSFARRVADDLSQIDDLRKGE